jgi:hypothetical protein
MTTATAGGSAAVSHVGAFDASALKDVQDTLNQGAATVLTGTADALPFPGLVMVNAAGVDAMTLATPVAGAQPAGDDGKMITIVDLNGAAHTITTATNKIVNSKHIETFNGTKGSNVTLVANNGIWIPLGTPLGVTVS